MNESEQLLDMDAAETEDEDGIDPVLLEIFTNEAMGHIRTIEGYLENCHAHGDACQHERGFPGNRGVRSGRRWHRSPGWQHTDVRRGYSR